MQHRINMDLLVCQSENGFSLDELVKKVIGSLRKDATAKSPDLSFGGSRKTEIRNFSTVTTAGSSLKFPNFVFFEIHPKSGIVTFGSRVRKRRDCKK